ncbi:hypothetical protein H0H92_009770 [Tricholoma furcatifolium]|nr:hypothetical protein H0H92_009770 [Tricholoma furcatifolium]
MSGSSIHLAAQNKQLSLIQALLAEDPKSLNSLDLDERTPLHWAASSGAIDIVRFLIVKKAEVDKPDISGWTPLHISVSAGHDEVVQELVGAGADVNRKNDKGITPLHYAASKSRIDIGRFLISRGADINASDNANQVPLCVALPSVCLQASDNGNPSHRAATTGSVGFIKLLLEPSGAGGSKPRLKLNTPDRLREYLPYLPLLKKLTLYSENTPLHLAMDSAHAEAAVVLISAGADRTRLNREGERPEDVPGVGGTEQKQARQHYQYFGRPLLQKADAQQREIHKNPVAVAVIPISPLEQSLESPTKAGHMFLEAEK